jgi:hypothetical protein
MAVTLDMFLEMIKSIVDLIVPGRSPLRLVSGGKCLMKLNGFKSLWGITQGFVCMVKFSVR